MGWAYNGTEEDCYDMMLLGLTVPLSLFALCLEAMVSVLTLNVRAKRAYFFDNVSDWHTVLGTWLSGLNIGHNV